MSIVIIINSEVFASQAGFRDVSIFQKAHAKLVNESLSSENIRREAWTGSIAVGRKRFVESVKTKLRINAHGRKIVETNDDFYLKEEDTGYTAVFDTKKGDIVPGNTYFWVDSINKTD